MPAKPSFCRNLPEAIERLRTLPADRVGRRELEEILGVSKTVAWRLLRHCGGEIGPGSALVCDRKQLIARLEELLEDGGKVEFEVRRRQRLDEYLERIRPQVVASRRQVVPPARALDLLNTRFASLPSNITLTRRNLHVEFVNSEEFLAAIAAVIYALNNDFEAMEEFLGGPSTGGLPDA